VSVVNLPAAEFLAVIPSQVTWCYSYFGVIYAVGLTTIFLRGDWQRARGIEKLILFGPIFYAAPLGAFGTEHFTISKVIASLVPAWIPWHMFWTYVVGACFIAAALSMVTRLQARLAAALVGMTFFLFVVLMDAAAWAKNPHSRLAMVLTLRELAFSGGALALASCLSRQWPERRRHFLSTTARYFIAIPVLVYSFEQLAHGDHVPAVPLERLTPTWIYGHAIWTYFAAVVYAIACALLLVGKKARSAAAWLGATILFVELVVYVPLAVVERATLLGFNFMADTLMFCGAVLLLAAAMPGEDASSHR